MSRMVIRAGLALGAFVVVGYPLSVWYSNAHFAPDASLLITLFPAFGLSAFTIMYLHLIGRPFAAWLDGYVSFARFERVSSYLVLVSIILHPLLRTIALVIRGISLWPSLGTELAITLGGLGFILLISYDLGKTFQHSTFVTRHWGRIDVASTLGFYVIWVHSLLLGSEVQMGFLHSLWIFYGVSAAVASLYVFVYRPFTKVTKTAGE